MGILSQQNYDATVEKIAKTMYYDNEYMDMPSVERVMEWEKTNNFTRRSYRESAIKIMRALGLELEWGVRTSEHVDDIVTPYANEHIAFLASEEIKDEEPERDARLVHRLVGIWEETEL